MSRSYRKHNVIPCACCKSEKVDKKIWHSRFRSKCKKLCELKKYDDEFCANDFPHFREVSWIWDFSKDGKMYLTKKLVLDSDIFRMHHTRDGKLYK